MVLRRLLRLHYYSLPLSYLPAVPTLPPLHLSLTAFIPVLHISPSHVSPFLTFCLISHFLVACTRLYAALSVRRSVAISSEHATYGDRPCLKAGYYGYIP